MDDWQKRVDRYVRMALDSNQNYPLAARKLAGEIILMDEKLAERDKRIEALERVATAASHYVQTFEGGEWSLGGGSSEALGLLRTRQARREALKNAVKAWEAMGT